MEKIRKGNDIRIQWEIFVANDTGESPYNLEGKNLTLYLRSAFGKTAVKDFGVSGNAVTFTFMGKDQSHTGKYTLTLVENEGEGGMHTVDECDAFELVNCSCNAGGDAESKVEIATLNLRGTMALLGGGTIEVDDHLSETSINPVQNKVITAELNERAKKNEIPTRTSQLYNDSNFVNGNAVPTKTSQLTNDNGFITKQDVATPDWSASTYKDGHIKNRTHHLQDYMCYEFKGSPVSISKPSGTGYVLLTYDTDMAEKYMKIEIKAGEYKTEEFVDAMGLPIIFTWDGNSTINVQTFGGALESYSMRAYYSSSAKGFEDYFIALDEGFIPKTIARKTDIPTKVSQLEQDVPGGGGSYDDTEIRKQLTELSAEIKEVVGGDSLVYEETKVQTIRYMKIAHPFTKGQILEITLTENEVTMSQGIKIYRSVTDTANYTIGQFTSVGETIKVTLDADAPNGLLFENLDAFTTYGVKVVAVNHEVGRLNVAESQIVGLIENVDKFSDSAEKIDSVIEEEHSINLFNKSELVTGYIQETNGTIFSASTTSFCSALIPIKGSHYYLLSGRDYIGTTGIRCLDKDGNILKVLAAASENERQSFVLPNESGDGIAYNGQFKTPNNAAYVQFSVIFSGNGSVDKIMLTDLGETYSPNPPTPTYKPFGTTVSVKYDAVPNPLLGKSVIFTGDSICHATTDYTDGGGWAKRIGEKNGMAWANRGISGGTIIRKEIVNGYFTISETDFGNGADYIILEGGTNDADLIGSILNGEKPSAFGSWSSEDYKSNFTNDTFCGALEMMLKKVITDFPTAKVGFVIAMKMGLAGQSYTTNRKAYFDTIMQICKKWGVPVLNLWDNCTMNPNILTHTELYADGQHPTGKGYDFITPIIEAWMKNL